MTRLSAAMIGISCLVLGALAATWLGAGGTVAPATQSTLPASDAAFLDDRIVALEASLKLERASRQVLEDELLLLRETVDSLTGSTYDDSTPTGQASRAAAGETEDTPATMTRRFGRSFDEDSASRRERLVEAGFTDAEAREILRRESELRMQALEARYEAERSGEPMDARDALPSLRDELGDDAYERYLDASGRATSVTVGSVFESSPARAAGLQPGDEIVRYDGERVFSMRDIVDLTMEGAVGESVTVDIVRDGLMMQLSVPRGPLGVSGGRRYRR